jgi:hypothetical protein
VGTKEIQLIEISNEITILEGSNEILINNSYGLQTTDYRQSSEVSSQLEDGNQQMAEQEQSIDISQWTGEREHSVDSSLWTVVVTEEIQLSESTNEILINNSYGLQTIDYGQSDEVRSQMMVEQELSVDSSRWTVVVSDEVQLLNTNEILINNDYGLHTMNYNQSDEVRFQSVDGSLQIVESEKSVEQEEIVVETNEAIIVKENKKIGILLFKNKNKTYRLQTADYRQSINQLYEISRYIASDTNEVSWNKKLKSKELKINKNKIFKLNSNKKYIEVINFIGENFYWIKSNDIEVFYFIIKNKKNEIILKKYLIENQSVVGE